MALDIPTDLVDVGRVVDAWGIRGGVKIAPYAADAAVLRSVRTWWFRREGLWRRLDVQEAKTHGTSITALLEGVSDRDAAEALRGADVAVERSQFPQLADDEYYWVDLIGLQVVDVGGTHLGRVVALQDNGAHAILELERDALGVPGEGTLLIPFVAKVIQEVSLADRRIVADWSGDY